VRYFSNRELSQTLGIKLAKWKRWCREFLAPDPLGGMQSGYARQLTIDDAFTVYLGGYLVGELKYGIQTTRQILADLRDWLGACGFYRTPMYRSAGVEDDQGVLAYQIYITTGDPMPHAYTIRGILEERVEPAPAGCFRTVRYWERILGGNAATGAVQATGDSVRLLNISSVQACFLCYFDSAVPAK